MPNAIALDLSSLDFAKGGGVVSVVVQDATSGVVLMTAVSYTHLTLPTNREV